MSQNQINIMMLITTQNLLNRDFIQILKLRLESQIGETRIVINIVNLFHFHRQKRASSVLAIIVLSSFVYTFFKDVARCIHFTFM